MEHQPELLTPPCTGGLQHHLVTGTLHLTCSTLPICTVWTLPSPGMELYWSNTTWSRVTLCGHPSLGGQDNGQASCAGGGLGALDLPLVGGAGQGDSRHL